MPFLGFLGNFHHSWKLQPEPDVGFMQLGGFDVTILLIKFHILSLRLLFFFLWPHIAIKAQTSGVWVRRHVCILRVLYVKRCRGCQESYSLFALTNRMCYFPEGNQFPLQQCKYSESSDQHAEGLCRTAGSVMSGARSRAAHCVGRLLMAARGWPHWRLQGCPGCV